MRVFFDQTFNIDISRAKYMGIDKFVVISPKEKTTYANSPLVKLEKDMGRFSVYSHKPSPQSQTTKAEILNTEPISFIGDFSLVDRSEDQFDFSRLQEEVLYHSDFDVTFALSPTVKIEQIDYANFKSIFLLQYSYEDSLKAKEAISQYLGDGNNIFYVRSDDPLSLFLDDQSNTGSVIALPRFNSDTVAFRSYYENIIQDVRENLKETSQSSNTNKNRETVSLENKKSIAVEFLDGAVPNIVPVLVKYSYFPAWKNTNGQPVYLAGPGFILTFAQDNFELRFYNPRYVYVGYCVTILTIICLCWCKKRRPSY
jgi:hypothetical protein